MATVWIAVLTNQISKDYEMLTAPARLLISIAPITGHASRFDYQGQVCCRVETHQSAPADNSPADARNSREVAEWSRSRPAADFDPQQARDACLPLFGRQGTNQDPGIKERLWGDLRCRSGNVFWKAYAGVNCGATGVRQACPRGTEDGRDCLQGRAVGYRCSASQAGVPISARLRRALYRRATSRGGAWLTNTWHGKSRHKPQCSRPRSTMQHSNTGHSPRGVRPN